MNVVNMSKCTFLQKCKSKTNTFQFWLWQCSVTIHFIMTKRHRLVVFWDLETNFGSPNRTHIIEIGGVLNVWDSVDQRWLWGTPSLHDFQNSITLKDQEVNSGCFRDEALDTKLPYFSSLVALPEGVVQDRRVQSFSKIRPEQLKVAPDFKTAVSAFFSWISGWNQEFHSGRVATRVSITTNETIVTKASIHDAYDVKAPGVVMVGHNIHRFDLPVLALNLTRHFPGMQPLQFFFSHNIHTFYDTLVCIRARDKRDGIKRSRALSKLFEGSTKVSLKGAHRACFDAYANLVVCRHETMFPARAIINVHSAATQEAWVWFQEFEERFRNWTLKPKQQGESFTDTLYKFRRKVCRCRTSPYFRPHFATWRTCVMSRIVQKHVKRNRKSCASPY